MQRKDIFPAITLFSDIPPSMARIVILCLIGLAVYGILLGDFTNTLPAGSGGGEDLRAYRRIVERVHGGEGYYEAAWRELQPLYPTGSLFNWRLPYLGWMIGHLPDPLVAQGLGVLLALLTLWLWFVLARDSLSFPMMAAGSLLLIGAPAYSFVSDLFLAHEFWAGCLITLSILAYAANWRPASLVAAILALMVREWSLLYVAVMLALSFRERKAQEALHWLAAIVLFAALMAVHFAHVREYTGGAVGDVQPWIALGGWKFVLATCSMHPYLIVLPPWLTAVAVPLALLGLMGWRGLLGLRIAATVCVYMTAFLFVGQGFNRYWGVLYVNLLPLGLLFAPAAAADLARSALVSRDGKLAFPLPRALRLRKKNRPAGYPADALMGRNTNLPPE